MATKKVSRTKNAGRIVYTLGKGGPSLFDLRTNTREVILLVTGPGMLFDHLEVLTTLSAAAGATAKAWQAFTKGIDCVAHCSNVSKLKIMPELKRSRVGMRVHIALGPIGMYQTELILRVRKRDSTFRKFFDEVFGHPKRAASYSVFLYPAIATGHPEHHHRVTDFGNVPRPAGTAPETGPEHHH
jgi:hypothetical protein